MFSAINSEMLGYAWKLAHNIPAENIEKLNLPKICNELNSWVTSESVLASRRLSLRSSSTIIAGAAKLYKQSLDKLFDDVKNVNDDIIYRRKRERLDSSSSESSDSTDEEQTDYNIRRTTSTNMERTFSMDEVLEEMRQPASVNCSDLSFSPSKRRRTDPIIKVTPRITMSRSPSDNFLVNVTKSKEKGHNERRSVDNNLDTEHAKISNIVSTENNVEQPFSEENAERQNRDEGVQRSPILISKHTEKKSRKRVNKGTNTSGPINQDGFDRNLPFGYIFIHETSESRIPSKIIVASLNSNVNNPV